MIEIEHHSNQYLICRIAGTLTKADYDSVVPELEHAIQSGETPPSMMIVLEDFRGWEVAALWEELRFDLKHGGDFDRIAVVGRSSLEKWGVRLTKPFFGAEIKYFDQDKRSAAHAWLIETR